MRPKDEGAAAAAPAVCLLHLNFEPCPWCAEIEAKKADDEVEATIFGGEVEAATIDTTPRRRGRPPKPRP